MTHLFAEREIQEAEPADVVIARDGLVTRRRTIWEPQPQGYQGLATVYRKWESLRPNGEIPNRQYFELEWVKSIMPTTSLIDVSADDPLDYSIRFVGTDLPKTMHITKQRLRDFPDNTFRKMLLRDYFLSRQCGIPLFHEIAVRIDGLTTCYARLILPFGRDGRRVDQLLVCSIYASLPDLKQRL
jgi:hypothetical protein